MRIDDTTRLARDSFYVTVGFGVIGFQKLQVRRRELEAQLDAGAPVAGLHHAASQVAEVVGAGVRDLDDLVSSVERHVDATLESVEGHLPGPTREVVHHARDAARAARSAVVDRFLGDPGPSA